MPIATPANTASIGLPTGTGTYIYRLARITSECVAAISSDDSLTFFEPATLHVRHAIRGAHKGITALSSGPIHGHCVTAGRDGAVRMWNDQGKKVGIDFTTGLGDKPVFSAVAASERMIAAGTENIKEGPGDVGVYIWNMDSPATPYRKYTESHNDTITGLAFHPTRPASLLSSATDALLTLFDTTDPDESEAAVQQVFNHSAAVHCATFLSADEIGAVSSDEQLAVYGIIGPEDVEREEVAAVQTVYGDVREQLGAGYVVCFARADGCKTWMASGNLEKQSLTLTPMVREHAQQPTKFTPDHARSITFPGGHGEEVVRDVLLDPATGSMVSCGEDGMVRTWHVAAALLPGSNNAAPTAAAVAMADGGAGDGDEMEVENNEVQGAHGPRDKKEARSRKKRRRGEDAGEKRFTPY